MIQHIVLFTPKPGLPAAERRRFAEAALDTLAGSPDIQRFTLGRRVEVDAGYPRSFGDAAYAFAAVLEFADRGALVRYLTSPRHAELGRLFWELCERTVVTEVEVARPDAGPDALVAGDDRAGTGDVR